jgi:MFS family permease
MVYRAIEDRKGYHPRLPVSDPAQNAVYDSPRAWLRLAVAFTIASVGSAGMWVPQTVLPMLQQEFGITRADASLPYTVTMMGVGFGAILMGRITDRIGVFVPLLVAGCSMCVGYLAASHAASLTEYALAQGLLIAFLGSSMTFAPLVAEVSLWFRKHLGVAVSIAAMGNYAAGMLWPPLVQYAAENFGWRTAYMGVGIASLVVIVPLAFMFRTRAPGTGTAAVQPVRTVAARPLGFAPNTLQALIALAGVSCCIAMSMPQVHIVALCSDLGYGTASGAVMLSLMLGFGMVSRFASGFIADRIGGLWTVMLGSVGQLLALALFLPFDGLNSLYVLSALFGLVQGGIVSTYAIVIREHFPANQAATRVSIALTATVLGMALGGWLTGLVFDLSGSYSWAFVHGIAWNALNIAIIAWLIVRKAAGRRQFLPSTAEPAVR